MAQGLQRDSARACAALLQLPVESLNLKEYTFVCLFVPILKTASLAFRLLKADQRLPALIFLDLFIQNMLRALQLVLEEADSPLREASKLMIKPA